jgi:hypothetical protein
VRWDRLGNIRTVVVPQPCTPTQLFYLRALEVVLLTAWRSLQHLHLWLLGTVHSR